MKESQAFTKQVSDSPFSHKLMSCSGCNIIWKNKEKPLFSNIQLFKAPTITLYNNSVKRTDTNLQTRTQTELETNASGCPWQQQELGFSQAGVKQHWFIHTQKIQGCWGRWDLEMQCPVRSWMFPYTWISIPGNADLIKLPHGTLLHFQMFSHRVIEILQEERTHEEICSLQAQRRKIKFAVSHLLRTGWRRIFLQLKAQGKSGRQSMALLTGVLFPTPIPKYN